MIEANGGDVDMSEIEIQYVTEDDVDVTGFGARMFWAFGFYIVIWVILAFGTAYRIGSGKLIS